METEAPMSSCLKEFKGGVAAGLSLLLPYFSVSVIFGATWTAAGLPALLAVISSAFIFAGAAQFILLGLKDAPVFGALFAIAVNLRHLAYGSAMAAKRLRPLLALGLTDEVFAIAHGAADPCRVLGVETVAYAAWVLGTAAGATLGLFVPKLNADAVLGVLLLAVSLRPLKSVANVSTVAWAVTVFVALWLLSLAAPARVAYGLDMDAAVAAVALATYLFRLSGFYLRLGGGAKAARAILIALGFKSLVSALVAEPVSTLVVVVSASLALWRGARVEAAVVLSSLVALLMSLTAF